MSNGGSDKSGTEPRSSSLVAVHKLGTADPAYANQLASDLIIAKRLTEKESIKDEAMNMKMIYATAALLACPTLVQSHEASPKKDPPPNTILDASYEEIPSFIELKAKLLSDGWVPVRNPDCLSDVMGANYEERCRDDPGSARCRACTTVPEIFRSTLDGYSLMRYVKNGVPLSVTIFGSLSGLDDPQNSDLVVAGWTYSESLDLVLLEEDK